MKEIVHTSDAPEAIGPYSQATIHRGIVYCSGQIGLDPETMEFVGDDVESQAKQVMENLEAVLLEAGSSFNKVLKCSIFLADMDDFQRVNEIYGSFFKSDPPARETVAVKTLPKNCKVEISCIAYV
ncbi:MAG: RidA family protein [Balneolaceae bacterium]|nr:RidA family protein [Balneolaceae bacterium]